MVALASNKKHTIKTEVSALRNGRSRCQNGRVFTSPLGKLECYGSGRLSPTAGDEVPPQGGQQQLNYRHAGNGQEVAAMVPRATTSSDKAPTPDLFQPYLNTLYKLHVQGTLLMLSFQEWGSATMIQYRKRLHANIVGRI